MRTTVNLDADVLDRLRKAAANSRTPFGTLLNETIRRGLDSVEEQGRAVPYRTKARPMGLLPELSLDNTQELIARVEGETNR